MNDVTLCDHLIEDAHLGQPFALLASDDGAAYLCPLCLATQVEGRIETQSAAELGAAISFAHCDHVADRRGTHCHLCEVAGTSALAQRWALLKFTEPSTANRLGKLLRIIGQRYNRCAVRAIDPGAETEAKPKPVHSARLLKSESLNGDRARAASKWRELREQRLLTHKAPSQTVRVIPPNREATAVA